MPILNWIGKEKIANHDKDVPFRLLKKNAGLSLGKSENLIVEGDNLEALKALMPYYYGKVKCIYIDPPYNTGNEKWVYNDRVNSPKIKEWLGKVVGAEGEDLTRHDKWLCMMYPRLKLLRDLLSDDGVIFISIDDTEYCSLRQIANEIFREDNFLANLIWKKKQGGGNDSANFVNEHEYVICYAKQIDSVCFNLDSGHILDDALYPFKDKNGEYGLITLDKSSIRQSESLVFDIVGPDGTIYKPRKIKGKRSCWRWSEDKVEKEYNKLVFKNGKVYTKYYRPAGVAPKTLLIDSRFGRTETGKEKLVSILGENIFSYPKPVELIKHLINISTDKTDIVLDSFAGSGTTAHAVLELNKDGGNRKFILVEMEKDICRNITAERVRRVTKGYSYKKANNETIEVQGLGGGFEYTHLGETLFNKDGMINGSVSFEDMARYSYFIETHTNLEKKAIKGNYLGASGDTHYFLLFDGIGKNVLNRSFLKELKAKEGKKIVYADKCLLGEEVLEKQQIIFKQIPYQVKVY